MVATRVVRDVTVEMMAGALWATVVEWMELVGGEEDASEQVKASMAVAWKALVVEWTVEAYKAVAG